MSSKFTWRYLVAVFVLVIFVFVLILYFETHTSRRSNEYNELFDVSVFEKQKNNLGSRVIWLDSDGRAEGGEMDVYFEKSNGSTKIIKASQGGETFRDEHDYYFNDINDFIVINRIQQWDQPYSVSSRKLLSDQIDKFYFKDLKMTVWLDYKGNVISSESEEFKQRERKIQDQLQVFLGKIAEKGPQIEEKLFPSTSASNTISEIQSKLPREIDGSVFVLYGIRDGFRETGTGTISFSILKP